MELYAKILLTDAITEDNTLSDYYKVLQAIFKLRDFCESPVTCADDLPPAEDGSQHFNNTVAYLQDSKALFCPIGRYSPTDPVISSCFHVFCRECIHMAFQYNNICSFCRAELSEFKIFSIPAHIFRDHNNPTSFSAQPSSSAVSAAKNLPSKVSAFIQMLVSSRNKSPSIKRIVFHILERF